MTTDDLRLLGQSIVDTCNALDAAQVALTDSAAKLAVAEQVATEDAAELASITSDNAALTAQITDLEAQIAALTPVDYEEFSDFAVQKSGYYLPTGTLLGKSAAKTVYRMKPNTSTVTATANAIAKGSTNPYRLMRVAGLDGTKPATVEVGQFTLQATDQGMNYGGLRVGYGSGSKVHDVTITGIPGSASGPPGETFSLELFHSDAAQLTNVTIDGRDATGKPVAATLLGYNFTTGKTVAESVVAQYSACAFVVAMWRCTGWQVFDNCDFRFNYLGINIEQDMGGTYDFTDTNLGTPTGHPWHAQVSAISGSAKVTFRNCATDGKPLVVRTYPGKTGNTQKDSDIRCFDAAGNDVTADPTRFRITHSDDGT